MTYVSNVRFPVNLPILDAKNYDKWRKQTNVLFDYQDVLEVIKNGVATLVEGATDPHRSKHKEEETKDFKALFFIHKCVDMDNFEKVGDCKSLNQAWEILEKAYIGSDKEKVVRLQNRKCQLELIQMEEKEIINDFTTRITWLVNQVKECEETITEQYVVAKILRSLASRFDNALVAIEETKILQR